MACEKYKKWVSDELDGELDSKNSHRLAAHLQQCSSCRIYRQKLQYLQKEAARLEELSPTPGFWEDFSARLSSKLLAEGQGKRKKVLAQKGWGYAWAGAAILFVAGLSLAIFLFFRPGKMAQEMNLLSFEKFLDRVYQEIATDPRLANIFDVALTDFLRKEIEMNGVGIRPYFLEDPLFIESLSEDEVEFIGWAIEKEINPEGG